MISYFLLIYALVPIVLGLVQKQALPSPLLLVEGEKVDIDLKEYFLGQNLKYTAKSTDASVWVRMSEKITTGCNFNVEIPIKRYSILRDAEGRWRDVAGILTADNKFLAVNLFPCPSNIQANLLKADGGDFARGQASCHSLTNPTGEFWIADCVEGHRTVMYLFTHPNESVPFYGDMDREIGLKRRLRYLHWKGLDLLLRVTSNLELYPVDGRGQIEMFKIEGRDIKFVRRIDNNTLNVKNLTINSVVTASGDIFIACKELGLVRLSLNIVNEKIEVEKWVYDPGQMIAHVQPHEDFYEGGTTLSLLLLLPHEFIEIDWSDRVYPIQKMSYQRIPKWRIDDMWLSQKFMVYVAKPIGQPVQIVFQKRNEHRFTENYGVWVAPNNDASYGFDYEPVSDKIIYISKNGGYILQVQPPVVSLFWFKYAENATVVINVTNHAQEEFILAPLVIKMINRTDSHVYPVSSIYDNQPLHFNLPAAGQFPISLAFNGPEFAVRAVSTTPNIRLELGKFLRSSPLRIKKTLGEDVDMDLVTFSLVEKAMPDTPFAGQYIWIVQLREKGNPLVFLLCSDIVYDWFECKTQLRLETEGKVVHLATLLQSSLILSFTDEPKDYFMYRLDGSGTIYFLKKFFDIVDNCQHIKGHTLAGVPVLFCTKTYKERVVVYEFIEKEYTIKKIQAIYGNSSKALRGRLRHFAPEFIEINAMQPNLLFIKSAKAIVLMNVARLLLESNVTIRPVMSDPNSMKPGKFDVMLGNTYFYVISEVTQTIAAYKVLLDGYELMRYLPLFQYKITSNYKLNAYSAKADIMVLAAVDLTDTKQWQLLIYHPKEKGMNVLYDVIPLPDTPLWVQLRVTHARFDILMVMTEKNGLTIFKLYREPYYSLAISPVDPGATEISGSIWFAAYNRLSLGETIKEFKFTAWNSHPEIEKKVSSVDRAAVLNISDRRQKWALPYSELFDGAVTNVDVKCAQCSKNNSEITPIMVASKTRSFLPYSGEVASILPTKHYLVVLTESVIYFLDIKDRSRVVTLLRIKEDTFLHARRKFQSEDFRCQTAVMHETGNYMIVFCNERSFGYIVTISLLSYTPKMIEVIETPLATVNMAHLFGDYLLFSETHDRYTLGHESMIRIFRFNIIGDSYKSSLFSEMEPLRSASLGFIEITIGNFDIIGMPKEEDDHYSAHFLIAIADRTKGLLLVDMKIIENSHQAALLQFPLYKIYKDFIKKPNVKWENVRFLQPASTSPGTQHGTYVEVVLTARNYHIFELGLNLTDFSQKVLAIHQIYSDYHLSNNFAVSDNYVVAMAYKRNEKLENSSYHIYVRNREFGQQLPPDKLYNLLRGSIQLPMRVARVNPMAFGQVDGIDYLWISESAIEETLDMVGEYWLSKEYGVMVNAGFKDSMVSIVLSNDFNKQSMRILFLYRPSAESIYEILLILAVLMFIIACHIYILRRVRKSRRSEELGSERNTELTLLKVADASGSTTHQYLKLEDT